MKHQPDEHQAHEQSLAERLINDRIKRWLDTAIGTELAGYGDINSEEIAATKALQQLRSLALSGYWYTLTPQIIDELKRAGLLDEREGE